MTVEQRVELLEQEIVKLQRKQVGCYRSAYAVASQNCKACFDAVKLEGQHFRAQMACEEAARKAFREKHKVGGMNCPPSRYIDTEEKGAEYVSLFKAFLTVYQQYLQQGEGGQDEN